MSTQERYDLVILGSGSTAFAAALHAAELGKSVVMTEFRTVGGTCANRFHKGFFLNGAGKRVSVEAIEIVKGPTKVCVVAGPPPRRPSSGHRSH
jgi:thioredoxin reductase